MTNEALCQQKRNEIMAYAYRLADEGAHYLWGAEGLRPSQAAQTHFAPVVLREDAPEQSTFCAAVLNGYVCAGRVRHKQVASLPPVAKISEPRTDRSLTDFIKQYKNSPNAQCGWGTQLTPRLVQGDDVMDYGGTGTKLTGKVVWGEGCDETLHFDCGGFVRHVVKHVCGTDIHGISDNPEKLNARNKPMGSVLALGDAVLPGDLFVYKGHIGFADRGPHPPYAMTTHYTLVQAESASLGVNYGHKHGQQNQKCIRLSESTLLNL
jgi:hypothetical protein